ncbi:unnamed protein product, partial [Amoebophrya sp. A25]
FFAPFVFDKKSLEKTSSRLLRGRGRRRQTRRSTPRATHELVGQVRCRWGREETQHIR